MKLTVKRAKELLSDLPDDMVICYHDYYKGCGLRAYTDDKFWLYPKGSTAADAKLAVINPGECYDGRASSGGEGEQEVRGV